MYLTEDDIVNKPRRYPLTDICVDKAENLFVEIALSGFSKEMLEVELVDNILIVRGVYVAGDDESAFTYLWKNISCKDFERRIELGQYHADGEISVEFDNGLLTIMVVPYFPEPEPEVEPTRKLFTID